MNDYDPAEEQDAREFQAAFPSQEESEPVHCAGCGEPFLSPADHHACAVAAWVAPEPEPHRTLRCAGCGDPLLPGQDHLACAREVLATLEAQLTEAGLRADPPLDYHRGEYEPAPVDAPRPVLGRVVGPLLPEAPASLNLDIPLPGGGRLMYTARGHDDSVIDRLPDILARLERAITPAPAQESWLVRLKRAVWPGYSGK